MMNCRFLSFVLVLLCFLFVCKAQKKDYYEILGVDKVWFV